METHAYALIERKSGKVVWCGIRRPTKEKLPDGIRWYMFDGYTLLVEAHKLIRVLVMPERKRKV